MTREEAIEVLKLVDENASCDDCLYYAQMEDCPTDEDCIIVQAVNMAIKALSQEPTIGQLFSCEELEELRSKIWKQVEQEPCEDAVSRDAVLQAVSEGCQEWRGLYGRCEELINALPFVTPTHKHVEPTQKNNDNTLDALGDAISREAVMKIVDEEWICNADYDFRSLVESIEKLPSVTQKSGKWINDKDDMPTCSQCGYIPPYSVAIDDYEYSNYCPNCGARMESEEV